MNTAAETWCFERARSLHYCGAWKRWLSAPELDAFLPYLDSPQRWLSFVNPGLKLGDDVGGEPSMGEAHPGLLRLQLRVRALLFDSTVTCLASQDEDGAVEPSAPAAVYNCWLYDVGSTAKIIPAAAKGKTEAHLRLDDVYHTLEHDDEDWERVRPRVEDAIAATAERMALAVGLDPRDPTKPARLPAKSSRELSVQPPSKPTPLPGKAVAQAPSPPVPVPPAPPAVPPPVLGPSQAQIDLFHQQVEVVLTRMKSLGDASAPFLQKVKKSEAPGYYDIIKNPMDIATMTKKLRAGKYLSKAAVQADIDLIVSNCSLYNMPGSLYVKWAKQVGKEAAKTMKSVVEIAEEGGDELARVAAAGEAQQAAQAAATAAAAAAVAAAEAAAAAPPPEAPPPAPAPAPAPEAVPQDAAEPSYSVGAVLLTREAVEEAPYSVLACAAEAAAGAAAAVVGVPSGVAAAVAAAGAFGAHGGITSQLGDGDVVAAEWRRQTFASRVRAAARREAQRAAPFSEREAVVRTPEDMKAFVEGQGAVHPSKGAPAALPPGRVSERMGGGGGGGGGDRAGGEGLFAPELQHVASSVPDFPWAAPPPAAPVAPEGTAAAPGDAGEQHTPPGPEISEFDVNLPGVAAEDLGLGGLGLGLGTGLGLPPSSTSKSGARVSLVVQALPLAAEVRELQRRIESNADASPLGAAPPAEGAAAAAAAAAQGGEWVKAAARIAKHHARAAVNKGSGAPGAAGGRRRLAPGGGSGEADSEYVRRSMQAALAELVALEGYDSALSGGLETLTDIAGDYLLRVGKALRTILDAHGSGAGWVEPQASEAGPPGEGGGGGGGGAPTPSSLPAWAEAAVPAMAAVGLGGPGGASGLKEYLEKLDGAEGALREQKVRLQRDLKRLGDARAKSAMAAKAKAEAAAMAKTAMPPKAAPKKKKAGGGQKRKAADATAGMDVGVMMNGDSPIGYAQPGIPMQPRMAVGGAPAGARRQKQARGSQPRHQQQQQQQQAPPPGMMQGGMMQGGMMDPSMVGSGGGGGGGGGLRSGAGGGGGMGPAGPGVGMGADMYSMQGMMQPMRGHGMMDGYDQRGMAMGSQQGQVGMEGMYPGVGGYPMQQQGIVSPQGGRGGYPQGAQPMGGRGQWQGAGPQGMQPGMGGMMQPGGAGGHISVDQPW